MNEEQFFHQALERPASQRGAFLDGACLGDPALRARLDVLLCAYENPGSFLAAPAADVRAAVAERPIAEAPGTVIGPYKLLEQIGEGGFGIVFLAEQTRPVRRRVALKVIKPGMDTRQVILRFEAERQALALMDHPNIARVLDAGTTGGNATSEAGDSKPTQGANPELRTGVKDVHDAFTVDFVTDSAFQDADWTAGRPYFVMELVDGVPITRYCDEHHLTLRERLELFVPVLQAVQHAHQKGIIHRDLKPSNVLVAEYDNRAIPKVIDFGVAKATGGKLTEKSMFTHFGQLVGTLEYMSPEQARFNQLDIDTRSDIYSLGVLLYELLTGATPFGRERLHAAAFDEMLRILRDEAPRTPSKRLSTLDNLPAVAANRHTEPARLSRLMRGELDWIVMKALEKDRSRRYETANSFAADVLHYLADEPVSACPPSRWYRLRKLAARNKGIFAVALASVLVVMLGVMTLAVSNSMIRQEQARTRDEKDLAEQARHLAEERADEVRQGLERLKAANGWLERGRWYVALQQWDDADAAFTQAVELRPEHAAAWVERGDFFAQLGLWDLASADFAQEFELREPDTTMRWFRHAVLRLSLGDVDEYGRVSRRMRERFRGTRDQHFAWEVVRTSVLGRDPDDAERLVEVAQQLANGRPGSWYELYVLGIAQYRAGHYEQSALRLRESLTAGPDWHGRSLSYPVLAMAHYRRGDLAEAQESLQCAADAIDRWTREMYEGRPRRAWAVNQGAGAIWPIPWWDWLECQLYFREAKLVIDGSPPPEDPRLHVLRARAIAGLYRNFTADDQYAAILQRWPDDPQVRLEAHRCAGYSAVERGEWGTAAAEFARACELRPDDAYLWRFRAVACLAAGDRDAYRQVCTAVLERFEETDDPETAGNVLLVCTLTDDALTDMDRLLPLTRVADRLWHWGAWARGAALYRAGRYEESVRCFERAATMYRPNAWDWCFLAMAHHRLGHADEARRCAAEAGHWIAEANRRESDDLTGTRPLWGGWHEPVVYPLLLREAEELLKTDSPIGNTLLTSERQEG